MPSLNELIPKTQQMYVVVCVKAYPGITQVFGPYTNELVAEEDAISWDGVDGWVASVEPVYPRDTKLSLLRPSKIGRPK